MEIQTDHRPKRSNVYLSSKSNFQRLGRESAQLNLKRHSRPLATAEYSLLQTTKITDIDANRALER